MGYQTDQFSRDKQMFEIGRTCHIDSPEVTPFHFKLVQLGSVIDFRDEHACVPSAKENATEINRNVLHY